MSFAFIYFYLLCTSLVCMDLCACGHALLQRVLDPAWVWSYTQFLVSVGAGNWAQVLLQEHRSSPLLRFIIRCVCTCARGVASERGHVSATAHVWSWGWRSPSSHVEGSGSPKPQTPVNRLPHECFHLLSYLADSKTHFLSLCWWTTSTRANLILID